MPIEDALILITRNFKAYMRGEKFEVDGPAIALTEKHPEPVQVTHYNFRILYMLVSILIYKIHSGMINFQK